MLESVGCRHVHIIDTECYALLDYILLTVVVQYMVSLYTYLSMYIYVYIYIYYIYIVYLHIIST